MVSAPLAKISMPPPVATVVTKVITRCFALRAVGKLTVMSAAVDAPSTTSSPVATVYGLSASAIERMVTAVRLTKFVLIVEREAETVSVDAIVVMGVDTVLMIVARRGGSRLRRLGCRR